MLADVGQRLLRRPKQHDLGCRAQRTLRTLDRQARCDTCHLGIQTLRQASQRPDKSLLAKRWRGQRRDQGSGLGKILTGRGASKSQVLSGLGRVAIHGCLRCLQQNHDAGEALRESVMDLPGEPLALGRDPVVVAERGELGARALEILDQPGTRLLCTTMPLIQIPMVTANTNEVSRPKTRAQRCEPTTSPWLVKTAP